MSVAVNPIIKESYVYKGYVIIWYECGKDFFMWNNGVNRGDADSLADAEKKIEALIAGEGEKYADVKSLIITDNAKCPHYVEKGGCSHNNYPKEAGYDRSWMGDCLYTGGIRNNKAVLHCNGYASSSIIKIRMCKTVKPDLPLLFKIGKTGTIAKKGEEYKAVANKQGAISAVCENGELLGVKPGEFEFVEVPKWVYEIWIPLLEDKSFEKLKNELGNAIGQYGEDHVDVMVDIDNNKVYGMYHSKKNSFPVTKDYSLATIGMDTVIEYCKANDIAYCEDI